MAIETRKYPLNNAATRKGRCVVYIMSRDQRVHDNHALIAAQEDALTHSVPLVVLFCLYKARGAAREHYEFMLAGLQEVDAELNTHNIAFHVITGEPYAALSRELETIDPQAVYFDFSPLLGPQNLRKKLAHNHKIPMYEVDAHNIVPTRVISDKQEYGAYTIRPKIHKVIGNYLVTPPALVEHPYTWGHTVQSLEDLADRTKSLLRSLPSNGTKTPLTSGSHAAQQVLDEFIKTRLEHYDDKRNEPAYDGQSNLSAYLHFGQISSLAVVLRMQELSRTYDHDVHLLRSPKIPDGEQSPSRLQAGIDALVEEIVVRKELSDNFCFYNPRYDKPDASHNWALKTLSEHANDDRQYEYTLEQLENAQTHDGAWNAAQRQMTTTGKMHGYMRMYWAKKILEWSKDPGTALRHAIYLNDFYSLDGRDPNGYAGIQWAIYGLHDRAWTERPVYGKIRYMNYEGLKRKMDIAAYELRWS